MTNEELINRWDTYLGKLKDRFYEILNQTDEPLNDVINNLQYDNVPRPAQRVRTRNKGLSGVTTSTEANALPKKAGQKCSLKYSTPGNLI